MATTQPLQNVVDYDQRTVRRVPIAAATTIYRGSLVGYDASGDAIGANDAGPVIGFAVETVANTTANGGGTAGDFFVKVAKRGQAIFNGTANLAAAAQTGVNAVCYATDNDTVTDVDPGNTNVVGRVFAAEDFQVRHGMTNAVMVDFDLGS